MALRAAGLGGRILAWLIAQRPDLLAGRRGPLLLTPHAGELARLLGADRADIEARRLEHAERAAGELDAVVLLKGSTTVVAAPDGRVRVNPTGTPWLATAGSGDVLTGLAGALLAGGLEPFEAGSVAAWLHGLAGRIAAAAGPPTAYDVLAAVPAALRDVRRPDGDARAAARAGDTAGRGLPVPGPPVGGGLPDWS